MRLPLTRRQSLAGLLAGAAVPAALALPTSLNAKGVPAGPFRHGVASGDPDADSVILWTRVTTAEPSVPVRWELGETEDFKAVLASGDAVADAGADHTVKVLAEGLEPGRTYYYRFTAEGETSPTGRTRTLPTGRLDKLGIALISCSNYPFGHFNAYDAIAKDPEIDIVLHTGDYIYEYGADGWGGEIGKKLGRSHDPQNEIITLADYRRRHAQYKTDAGSRAMHGWHPMVSLWDDHESANNPWIGGAQNHQPETEGSWKDRRAASIRAYYEWMPIREPGKNHRRIDYWRSYTFGDLATLVTLESRHTGRGEQVDYAAYADKIASQEDAQTFVDEVIGDPSRSMLSPAMEAYLADHVAASVKAGQVWRVIGNAIPMARTNVPDVVALGVIPDPAKAAEPSFEAQALAWKGKWNLPFYPDTWDGYPAARERFYTLARTAGARDLVVLTGDSHSFWSNQLYDADGRAMGVELGTAGVTSPGDFLESGFDEETSKKLDEVFAEQNKEVRWTDNFHQGYVRVVLGREEGRADFVAMSTVLSPQYVARVIRSEKLVRQDGTVAYQG